jgi:outer membrane lipoprotein-sorting protein
MQKANLFLMVILLLGNQAMADLASSSSIDDVLDALQASGHNVKSFTADLKTNDYQAGNETEMNRFGKVWFQIKPDGNPVLHVQFDHKQPGGRKIIPEKKDYQLQDGWLTDRDDQSKIESRRQIALPGQKVDLFQLGKGPFPLPVGQDKSDVHKQFDVTKPALAKDDPADTIHLLLTPKPDSRLADSYRTVEIWVGEKTQMPVRIMTTDKHQNERTVDFFNLKTNPDLNPGDLVLPPLPTGWNTSDIPLQK